MAMRRERLTHTEEVHEVTDTSFDIPELKGRMSGCDRLRTAFRPHPSSSCLTLDTN